MWNEFAGWFRVVLFLAEVGVTLYVLILFHRLVLAVERIASRGDAAAPSRG